MAKDNKKKAQALPEGEEPQAAPKKSKKKRIIIILVVFLLMLAGVGAGGYWWFFIHKPGTPLFSSKAPEVETSAAEEPAKAEKAGGTGHGEEAKGQSARIEAPKDIPRSSGRNVVLPLPQITVNLFENGGHRYLKLGMEVEANKDISAAIKENEARIRDAVIMLLAGKSYREIASPDGKVMLKVEVANRLNRILGEQRVVRVYFTDFVVQ